MTLLDLLKQNGGMVDFKEAVCALGSEEVVTKEIVALVRGGEADIITNPASEEPVAICEPLLPIGI